MKYTVGYVIPVHFIDPGKRLIPSAVLCMYRRCKRLQPTDNYPMREPRQPHATFSALSS